MSAQIRWTPLEFAAVQQKWNRLKRARPGQSDAARLREAEKALPENRRHRSGRIQYSLIARLDGRPRPTTKRVRKFRGRGEPPARPRSANGRAGGASLPLPQQRCLIKRDCWTRDGKTLLKAGTIVEFLAVLGDDLAWAIVLLRSPSATLPEAVVPFDALSAPAAQEGHVCE